MADISKIKIPNVTTPYNIKDASALHMSSTAIGGTSTPIYWNGTTFTPTGAISSTDEKVKQTADASSTGFIPALLAYQASPTSGTSSTAKYVAKVGAVPSSAKFRASTYALNLPSSDTEAGVTVSSTADGGWVWSDQ